MSRYEAHRIEKPPHFRIAPSTRGRGKRRLQVIGFDSEAEDGRAFCLQFSVDGGPEDVYLLTVPERKHGALSKLMQFVSTQCTSRGTEYVMFGWNLMYEWTQLFPDFDRGVVALSEFAIEAQLTDTGQDIGTWTVTVFNDRRYAARFYNHETQRRVILLDGMAYFKTSLDKAGRALKAGEKVNLDLDRKKRFTRADLDDPEFRRYACTDAWLTRVIGEHIMDMHVEFDVATCLTAPHFAAQVFKRHFLTAEIPLPDPDLEQAGLAAYHGGKNGFYLPGPARLDRVHAYDITSAYPEAMRQLPDPTRATWSLRAYRPGWHALWQVTMDYHGCPYPGALTHDDRKLTPGRYTGLWLTSYELDAILERGEGTLVGPVYGFAMRGPGGGPLVQFVDRFFAQKATAGEGPMREQAKLFLNSLYGKFFQKVELGSVGWVEWATGELVETDPDQPFDFRAGGLYHPPIAALITGFVRARIHGLEHKYRSVMTSTDGFFGLEPPDPADMGAHLGGLTAQEGSLTIWRERLYVFDPDGWGRHCPKKKPCKAHKPKVALHGFRGNVAALRAVPLAPGDHEYAGTVTVSLRTARNRVGGRAVRAGQFVDTTFTLHLDGAAGATIGAAAPGPATASPPVPASQRKRTRQT